jgi:hypothetical protein
VEIILDFQPNLTYVVSTGENRLVSELQVRLTRRKAASFTLRLRLCVLGAQTAQLTITFAMWWCGRAFPVVAVILNGFQGGRVSRMDEDPLVAPPDSDTRSNSRSLAMSMDRTRLILLGKSESGNHRFAGSG